jgi:hypothetical protein
MRHVRVVVGATTLAAVGLTLVAPAPAGAGGGDWMDPDRDRYEPGQQATLVGYTEAAALRATEAGPVSDADWRTPGPYHAYLRVDPAAVENDDTPWSFVHPTDLRVGQVLVEEKTEPYLRLRVGVTFRLPEHLAPAMYTVMVCNDPCTTTLGYLMDSAVYVGMNPEGPVVRNWPLDEPLIRYLDDGALLADPAGQGDDLDDWTVTAAEVRAGYRPSPTATPAPAPAPPAPKPDGAPPSTTPPTKVRAPVDESPAVRAGADPPGGLPSEVIAWLVGLGVLIVVWCLAWRWRPQERRLVVRQADGHRPADAPDAADDEPEPVHVQL